MKKLFLLLIALVASTTISFAQSFKAGDNVATVNVGFCSSYGIPVNAYYERGIYDINDDMSIGVGGTIGWGGTSSVVGLPDVSEYSITRAVATSKIYYNNFLFGAIGNYHYTGFNNFDLYAGLCLGLDVATSSAHGVSASSAGFMSGINVGARYYFTDSFAANLEVGYGISLICVGLSYKF